MRIHLFRLVGAALLASCAAAPPDPAPPRAGPTAAPSAAAEAPPALDPKGRAPDAAHRADASAFFGPRAKNVDGAPRVLASALESIQLCEASHKAALPGLEAFLKKY